MRRRLLLLPLLLAACDEMAEQPRYDSYERSALFDDGSSLRHPPEGTVARDEPAQLAALRERPEMTPALLARGQERYGIACVPCHGGAGYGLGTVPARGFPQPPSYHGPRLRDVSSAYLVEVISQGHGAMYHYADRVAPADRWAIAAYVRALQLSQYAPLELLTEAERARLEALPAGPEAEP